MVQRKTLADYESFVYALGGLPPGEECERCARQVVRRLAAMYRERGLAPPAGLQAFAEKLGESLSAELDDD